MESEVHKVKGASTRVISSMELFTLCSCSLPGSRTHFLCQQHCTAEAGVSNSWGGGGGGKGGNRGREKRREGIEILIKKAV